MSVQKRLAQQRKRRAYRVRGRLKFGKTKPRVSVFRSLKQIYAQIIDDATHKTIASFSSLSLKDFKGDKKAVAKKVGLELAKIAKKDSIEGVVFDRGLYRYHGRVRALADGLREGGLKF